MMKLGRRRAVLLAGISMTAAGFSLPASATTAVWGALRAPADIAVPEPARKPKKQSTSAPASEPGTTGFGGFSFRPKSAEPVADEKPSKPKKAKSERKTKNEKAAATPEKSEPVIPPGPLHVIVSVGEQRASLYANGAFVASTKVSTGTKTHPTPLGVFSVIQKNRHHVSNLYGAKMPYMQRLTWSGTALHTGPLPGYPASHGCIRLTDEFAQLLWKATRLGARVIVTRDDVKPVEINHTRLALQSPPAVQSSAERSAETTGAMVRTADAAASVAAPEQPAGTFQPVAKDLVVQPPSTQSPIIDRKIAPVSIFISRKDGKLYVRQAMQPLFDMPLTIRDAAEPLGTHVYTAMEMKDGGMRWTAVTIPSAFPRETAKADAATRKGKKLPEPAPVVQGPLPSPSAALDRIELPQTVLDRLAGMITPGSSLIVSDNPLSSETGRYTDFIVLTR